MRLRNIAAGGAVVALTIAIALTAPIPTALAALPPIMLSPDDPLIRCQGPNVEPNNHRCDALSFDETKSEIMQLEPVQVTVNVAGCIPGSQPRVAKSLTYSFTSSLGFSASIAIKSVPGLKGIWGKILKEIGPQFGVSWSESTGFGESQTYTIPADYGKVSWGVFSQDAIVSTGTMTVILRVVKGRSLNWRKYAADGVQLVTPVVDEKTNFPKGTLAKDQRDFASVEEFNRLCPNGVLPKYLGGTGEPEPDPDPEPVPGVATCDRLQQIMTEGVAAGAISDHVATDLQNKCRNVADAIRDGNDPAESVTELTRSIQKAETDGHVTGDYAAKLNATATALHPTT